MGQYENGIETTNRILEASRKLFYEEGYQTTTFADIAELAKVNKSAIHYHFRSKENLLGIIVNDATERNNAVAGQYFTRNTVPLSKYLFSGMIYNFKLYTDDKYMRFFQDSMVLYTAKNLNTTIQGMTRILFWNDSEFIILTDERFHELMAIMGYSNSLLSYMAANKGSYTLHGINQYSCEMHKRILKIDDLEFKLVESQLLDMQRRCDWDSIDTTL